MKYHCGLLSERPDSDRTLSWVKRGSWDQGLPDDVERELRIWLAMPGFSIQYHIHTLRVGRGTVLPWLGDYERWKDEVAENWLSATREDCVRLCQLRPGMGDIPVISQLRMIDDLKAGRTATSLADEYRVHRKTVVGIGKGQIKFRGELPVGFSLLRV